MITKAWISYLVYKTRMRMKETPPASMRKEKTRTIAVDIVLTRAYALHQQDIDKWTASAISPRPLQGVDVDIHVPNQRPDFFLGTNNLLSTHHPTSRRYVTHIFSIIPKVVNRKVFKKSRTPFYHEHHPTQHSLLSSNARIQHTRTRSCS
jgi:hypothetical protein